MGIKDPVVGLRWGKLVIVAVDFKQVRVRGVTETETTVKLRCVCGQEFERDAELLDKRVEKDCGKCGGQYGAGLRPMTVKLGRPMISSTKRIPYSMTLPMALIAMLEDEAREKQMSVSRLVTDKLEATYSKDELKEGG